MSPKYTSDMKLLKIRDHFINIDLVQTAKLERDSIVLTISGESFQFFGADATLISNWLNRFALDLNRDQNTVRTSSHLERPPLKGWVGGSSRGGLFRKRFAS